MDIDRAKLLIRRGVKLRCPECGLGNLYRAPFRMRSRCEFCDLVYEREQGYFVGAIYVNVIVTESLLLGSLLIYVLLARDISETIIAILIVLAMILPLAFFHHSRSLWMSIDHILNPERRNSKEFSKDSGAK